MRKYRNTKVRLLLVCKMENTHLIQDNAYFQSKTYINLEKSDVKVFLKDMIKEIFNNINNYQMNGSGWYFKEVVRLEIHIVEYKPMNGESFIPLPEFIKKKNAIIKIQNEDNKCFLWSILRYLHPKEVHGERLSDLKKYDNELNFEEIKFPLKFKDITKFEKLNPNLPGINVFSINENNKVYPLRINKKKCKNNCQKSIDLFLHSDGEKQLYYLIKKTFQDWLDLKLQKIHQEKFIFVKTVLSITPKKIFLKNINIIVVKMKQQL